MVWTNPFGEIFVDQDIKLFEFCDIQKYSSYNDGPKSKQFCQFHTSSTSKAEKKTLSKAKFLSLHISLQTMFLNTYTYTG